MGPERSCEQRAAEPSRAVLCCAALPLCISERSGAEPGRQRPAFVRAACAFPSPSVYLFALSSSLDPLPLSPAVSLPGWFYFFPSGYFHPPSTPPHHHLALTFCRDNSL